MKKTVLILGGTGKLGVPVAKWLQQAGFQARIMTRSKEKAGKLFDNSFEIVVGDVQNADDLEKALNGCFSVHLSITPLQIEPMVAKQIAALALKKGIQRISYVSGTNNIEKNSWNEICRIKLEAEKIVRDTGIPYIIFCPTAVFENLPLYVQNNRASVFGKQPYPLHWFAADDFGRMVATAYQKDEALNKKLFIHGPEPIRTHDAVKRYCEALHPEIKKITSIPYWMAKIIAWLIRNDDMKIAIQATSFYEKAHGEAGDPSEANQLLGAPTTTLDQWLEQRKAIETP